MRHQRLARSATNTAAWQLSCFGHNGISAELTECFKDRRPSTSVDNPLLDLQNSSYQNQPLSIILLIIKN